VAVVAVVVGAVLALHQGKPSTNPAPRNTTLMLSTNTVAIGSSYTATAIGFAPGEPIRMSWTGPTNGLMGIDPTDEGGTMRHSPILERDPPGSYEIIATGVTSGRTATARLQVLPPP
jgi:hypothetical protein